MKTFMSGTQTEEDESGRLNISLTSPAVWPVSWFPHRCMLHAASTKALNGSSNAVYLKKQNKTNKKQNTHTQLGYLHQRTRTTDGVGRVRGEAKKERAAGGRRTQPEMKVEVWILANTHSSKLLQPAHTQPPFPEQLTRRGSNRLFCKEKQKNCHK